MPKENQSCLKLTPIRDGAGTGIWQKWQLMGISYSGMLSAILKAAKERYGLGITEKIEISCKLPDGARRKSPTECAAEFEEEVETNSSLKSETKTEQSVYSDQSEAVQALE